jgi:hypothetical protein
MKDKINEQLIAIREVILNAKEKQRKLDIGVGESLNVYRDLIFKSLSGKKKSFMNKIIPPIEIKVKGNIDAVLALSMVEQLLLLNFGKN